MNSPQVAAQIRVLALEPYYGGSHKAVLDGLVESVGAEWTVVTLPARKWKWRMRGAAIDMAARLDEQLVQGRSPRRPFDVIFASTFLNLAEFRGLVGPPVRAVPAVVYFHENQLVYPNRHTAEWDYQFPLTNITTALAAQSCVFNTQWNLDTFVGGIDEFIRAFPDHRPRGLAERIRARSKVIHPPFDGRELDGMRPARGRRVRIVWPHRWEHDKNPEAFFHAVTQLADEGLDFEVVVAGQSFRETEGLMREAASALGDRLVHCDEPASRAEYLALLSSADVAVSTAQNEFFGVAMMEACYAGCHPLVPDRLAYPELYPKEYRYADDRELVARLRSLVLHRPPAGVAVDLARPFTLEALAPAFEDELVRVARAAREEP